MGTVSLTAILLAPLLGIDNMIGAIGVAGTSRSRRISIETCVSFGLFAAVAVVIGTDIGALLAASLAHAGRFVAGLIIAGLGVRALWPVTADAARPKIPGVTTTSIVLLGIALSGDTLGAAVALGATHATQGAVAVITACTVAMTLFGLAVGARFDRYPVARKGVTGFVLIIAAYGVALGWI